MGFIFDFPFILFLLCLLFSTIDCNNPPVEVPPFRVITIVRAFSSQDRCYLSQTAFLKCKKVVTRLIRKKEFNCRDPCRLNLDLMKVMKTISGKLFVDHGFTEVGEIHLRIYGCYYVLLNCQAEFHRLFSAVEFI